MADGARNDGFCHAWHAVVLFKAVMDALEMTLLFDYYGELLTDRQRMCFDLRYNQDMSLGEIAEELQVSRQGVYDNLSRAEALLRNMEAKTGCVSRDLRVRKAVRAVKNLAGQLSQNQQEEVAVLAQEILSAVDEIEE